MGWVTINGKHILIKDYKYFKSKEIRLSYEEYSKVAHEINSNKDRWNKGARNEIELYNYKQEKYIIYKFYYEKFDKFVIIDKKESTNNYE